MPFAESVGFARAPGRVPVTVGFVLAYAGMFLAERFLLPGGSAAASGRFGISIETLADHQYWRIFTALFVPRDPVGLVEQIGFIVVMIGVYEWANGSLRAIALFGAADVTAKLLLVPLMLGPFGPALSFGIPDILTKYDVGISAGGMALLAASLHRYSAGWRGWAYMGGMGFLTAKILLWHQPLSDLMHITAFNIGFVLAPLFRRGPVAAEP